MSENKRHVSLADDTPLEDIIGTALWGHPTSGAPSAAGTPLSGDANTVTPRLAPAKPFGAVKSDVSHPFGDVSTAKTHPSGNVSTAETRPSGDVSTAKTHPSGDVSTAKMHTNGYVPTAADTSEALACPRSDCSEGVETSATEVPVCMAAVPVYLIRALSAVVNTQSVHYTHYSLIFFFYCYKDSIFLK